MGLVDSPKRSSRVPTTPSGGGTTTAAVLATTAVKCARERSAEAAHGASFVN
jgi:hypothetical protein